MGGPTFATLIRTVTHRHQIKTMRVKIVVCNIRMFDGSHADTETPARSPSISEESSEEVDYGERGVNDGSASSHEGS